MAISYVCPVCGYPDLDEEPRTEESGGSYDICPSCGFEFGVTDDSEGFTYEQWRTQWVQTGMIWWSNMKAPKGWNARKQLHSVTDAPIENDQNPDASE